MAINILYALEISDDPKYLWNGQLDKDMDEENESPSDSSHEGK